MIASLRDFILAIARTLSMFLVESHFLEREDWSPCAQAIIEAMSAHERTIVRRCMLLLADLGVAISKVLADEE